MTSLAWTEDNIAILRKMWATHSSSQIVHHFASLGYAVTRNAIIGKAHRLDLQLKTRTEHRPLVAQSLSAAAAPKQPGAKPRIRLLRPVPDGADILPGPSRKVPPPKPVSDAPAVSTVAFVPRVVNTGPLYLTLLQLTEATCKYECTKADDPALFRFCGRPSDGTPYCAAHHAICRQSPAAYAKKRVAA